MLRAHLYSPTLIQAQTVSDVDVIVLTSMEYDEAQVFGMRDADAGKELHVFLGPGGFGAVLITRSADVPATEDSGR